jgi:hypothetical protein
MHAIPLEQPLEQTGVSAVGVVLDRPQSVVSDGGPGTLPWLAAGTALGWAAFGAVAQLERGAEAMLRGALLAPAVVSVAFALALPALFVFGTALGGRLGAGATLRSVAVAGWASGVALLAGIPVSAFFALALPDANVGEVVDFLVLLGGAGCGIDVFMRTTRALDPGREARFDAAWLCLVAILTAELLHIFAVLS